MDASCGTNTVDIPVTLYRIPDQLSLTSIENCILDGTTDLEVITANTEVISGYTYTYTLSALSGGTFSLDAQGSDGSGLELDNISFATGSASITANINLSVGGLNASCTTSSIDIPVTLYRQVDQLTLTAIEECLQDGSTGLLIATENTNPVDSYTYSWSLTGLSGGSIDLRTSGTDDSGLYFDNISFTGSSTEITADLSLTVSGMDASCGTNTVTVSVNIHRLPDQLSLTAQEFCTLNGADNLQVVAENGTSLSGYSYSWTMNSISGGTVSMSATGTDGSGLEFDAITFGTGSSEITANVRLEITGMDASCGTNTVDIPVTLYRIPDQLSLTSIENCILDGTTDLEVVTANTEVISGYTYTYTLSALSGGTFSLDAQGSDGSGLELDNISFATGSASITANINLSVGGLNASCTTSSIDIPVTLYRQVDQLTLTAIEECLQDGSTGLLIATENTNPVDSYTYSWSLTGLSGGSIDLRTSGTDDSGLYFDNISFTGSSTEITADLSLTVSGIDASCGTNTVTVSVNIHRLPDQLSLTAQEFCTLNGTDNLQVAAENGTSLSGYSYSWTMNSISGGTVNMSATGTDGSGLEFDAITFGTGSSEITANVRLEITGMDASCGTNTVDIPVTLYRIPDQLSLTSLEECAADGETSLSMLSPNTENISGYTYSWSLSNFTGGTFTYSAYGNNNSGLDFESISFNGTSNEITADLQLIVAGISASCTSNTITIPVTIHRIPEQFAQNSIEECVLNGTTNLSVVDEVANPIDGYTYTWSISNIDGGSFNISPTGANNSGLNFDNIAFTDGRTQITADVSLEVGGISSTCNSTHTITVEINRIPDQLTLSSIISCEMDGAGNIQVVDPNTVALTDYTYTWSLDNLSGGAINIQTLGADNSGVEFNDIDFFGGGSKITADLNLSISGLDASCTQSTVSIPVEIYRQPDLSAYIAFESCVYNETEDLVLYEEQAETIVGYNYTWNISGISGGNVSYSSFGNNNSGFQLDEVTFNGGSNEITATIELELEGLDGSCTNTTVSIPLTLHRLPDQFDLAEIFIFLCEVDGTVVVEAVAENEVEIDDYVYAWTLSTPSGGTFNMEDFGVNNSGVNFKDIFFDAGSEVITANLNLVVNGLNPVCASASKDIPVTISLKAEEVVLPDTIPCVVDGESEVVFAEPRAELLVGITYSWAVSDLSGGTLETEAYGLSDTGLRFNNVNFEDGVDEITGTVTLTQTTDCSVTEQDTTFTLRRKADLTQFTPQSLCLVEGASNVELFAPQTETVSSFAYAWQIRSVNGGSFSLLATGSDSSGVNLNDVNFDEGVSQIIAEVEVTVTGGCETVSEVVDIVIERSADYSSFTDQDLCVRNGEVDVALFSERTELISGFTYGWTITSISGGTLSLVEFGNNNSGLQLTDIQFDDDATNIVVNIEVAVDGSCDTSPHNVEVTINRKPRLDDIADIVLCEVDGAASVLAMDELSDAVTLFSYNSTLVANSLDGGTFSLAQFGDSNSGINFENINFADGSNQILAEIEIEVQGGCEVVSAIIPVEINRKADLSYLADLELCELNGATNVVAIDTLAESVAGLSYVWAIDNSTLSGGTFELLPMGTNQTGLNLNNIQFLADSSQITADIIVISQGGCEDVSTTIRITINRELEFSSYTDVVLCLDGNEDTVLVYDEMEENISTYNFQWSLSENLQGGVMTVTPFGNMSSGLNFEDIEFADGSLEITGELLLTEVEGACDFSPLTIPVQIQRKPNLDEIPDISLCEVDGTTSVVAWEGISEAISAWNYKYTIDAASLSGGSFTLSTSGNSNSSLSLNTISFAEGSNQITAKVDVEVSGGCETVTKEILVEILRKEDLSTLEDVSVCETDSSTNVVLYDVFEETITGFSYSWSFVTGSVDGGSFTLSPQGSNNSGLEANDITFDVNSYEINAELELTVLGSCEDVSTIVSVQIRRSATFDQPLIYDFCAGENGSLVAVSNDTDLFNFTWAVDSISGANASRTTSLRTSIENTTTATLQDLFVNNEDFLDEEGIIEVVATITSTNKQNTSCTTSETYTIQFVRIPEVELPSSSVEGCSETPNILYPFGADDYTDVYNFSWSLVESSLTGTSTVGTTEIRSLINNSTAQNLEVLILDTYFLDASVTEINFDVELEATNKVVESCQSPSSSAVYSFTIKRSPLVELTETEGSCEDGSIQLQSNYAELSFLAYSWTLNDVQGGGLTSSDLNTFALNLQADYFDPTSYELSAWAKLEVENTLISDGCIGVDSTWVYFHRTPDPSFTMTSTVGCANQETVFDATSSGVPLGANTYEWDFNYDGTTFNTDLTTTDSIVSHEFSGEGTYTVALRITTSLGCTSSDIYQETFTIHPSPEAVFTAPLSVCIDEMVNFTNSSTSGIPNGSLSYSWSYLDEDGVEVGTDSVATPSYTFTTAGVYTVSLTVENELGCLETTTQDIEVLDLADISLSDNVFICFGESATLSVTGGARYEWSTGETTNEISVSPESDTLYTVTTYNINDCPRVDTVFVSVIPTGTLYSTQEACEGELVTLDASLEYDGLVQEVTWSTGERGTSIEVTEAGLYYYDAKVVHIESGVECTYRNEIDLTLNPLPAENYTDEVLFCFENNATLELSAVDGEQLTYLWLDTEETSRSITVSEEGLYSVLITDMSHDTECTTLEEISVREVCPPNFTPPTAFTPNDDGLNDYFYIQGEYLQNIKLGIYNRWGENIFYKEYADHTELKDPKNGWDGTYRGEKVPLGAYVYILEYESEFYPGEKFKEERSITVIY
ncbi:PKD domain-containing protein [Sediminitomix flava]|nr:PKD domain-containing protein [Sediminitomix flava]